DAMIATNLCCGVLLTMTPSRVCSGRRRLSCLGNRPDRPLPLRLRAEPSPGVAGHAVETVAVTVLPAFIVSVHVPVPAHAPPQADLPNDLRAGDPARSRPRAPTHADLTLDDHRRAERDVSERLEIRVEDAYA